jgi:hypothetical protein
MATSNNPSAKLFITWKKRAAYAARFLFGGSKETHDEVDTAIKSAMAVVKAERAK